MKTKMSIFVLLIVAALVLSSCSLPQTTPPPATPTPTLQTLVCPDVAVPECPVIPPTLTPTLTPEPTLTPTPTATPETVGCIPAKLTSLSISGEVINDLRDGDSVNGTILWVSQYIPASDPVLFVIMPGSSLDIEYDKMFFISDSFAASSSEEATCLADILYPDVLNKIIIGADYSLSGWSQLDQVDGWWTANTWLFQEIPISVTGMTVSPGIFVSTIQAERHLKTGENEVIYGQFWNPNNPGTIVDIQMRPSYDDTNIKDTIPLGWQGTYWRWTGDLAIGEVTLQKRILQATFKEHVVADNIRYVSVDGTFTITLLLYGELPASLDSSLVSVEYEGNLIFWETSRVGWTVFP